MVLFAAADRSDRLHLQAVSLLNKPGRGLLMGTFALMEFDVVLKSRGFSGKARRDEMTLLTVDFPRVATSVHPISPKTLYLASLCEERFGLGYFDSLLAAEASDHDGVIISTDREFERVPGLSRIPLD